MQNKFDLKKSKDIKLVNYNESYSIKEQLKELKIDLKKSRLC